MRGWLPTVCQQSIEQPTGRTDQSWHHHVMMSSSLSPLSWSWSSLSLSQCDHADQHNIHQMVRWQTVHENKPINIKPSVNCLWTNILAYHHVTIIITSPYAHSWLKCQMMKPNKLISNNLGGFVIGHKPIIAHGQYILTCCRQDMKQG